MEKIEIIDIKISDKNLIILFEILEKIDSKDTLEIVRKELQRRGIKRKVFVPAKPGKKSSYKYEDY